MNITHTISNKNQLEADFSRDIWCVLGLPFDNVTLNQTCNIITNAVEQKRHCFLSTPNLNFLCATQTDSDFRDSVQNSNLSIADGFPIIVIAKFLGIPLSERVAGSTLIEKLQTHSRKPIRVFFFGGEESAGEKAVEKINHSNQALKAVGSYYPAFGSIDDMSADDIIENINQAQADFVIVALGAKKGQAWIEKNRKKINAPVISHLGAVINFFAGSVKRAPPLFQKIGLEWVWRIYQEPKLWKRYWQDGLTLIHLFFAKVFPYAVWLRLNKKLFKNPSLLIKKENNKITLSGVCSYQNLNELKKLLKEEISNNQTNFIFDLENVQAIDNAFLGLLILLRKYSGNNLQLIHPSFILKTLFYWNGADFLLKNGSES